jgi:hypothetical protein
MKELLKNKYLIIDNLLKKNESNDVEKKLYDSFFPWFLTADRDNKNNIYTVPFEDLKKFSSNINVVDKGQFSHTFYHTKNNFLVENSSYKDIPLKIISNLINKINKKNINILRAKANLILESKYYTKNSYGVPHTDTEKDHYVLIYYVNDCDGDTVLFDSDNNIFKKISPKKGRGLFFKGNITHAGGHPVNSQTRCVINFNLNFKND